MTKHKSPGIPAHLRMIVWMGGGARSDFRLMGQPYKNPNDKRVKQLIKDTLLDLLNLLKANR